MAGVVTLRGIYHSWGYIPCCPAREQIACNLDEVLWPTNVMLRDYKSTVLFLLSNRCSLYSFSVIDFYSFPRKNPFTAPKNMPLDELVSYGAIVCANVCPAIDGYRFQAVPCLVPYSSYNWLHADPDSVPDKWLWGNG